ncbi:hypothetical protein EFK50_00945 [Nocardioides marmoriginsengisoli]|uniref:DUF4258 domain-containing protein n=1 Tax=Nocardioides marmoriginsengisoli TaxID=661483 RepID=A0A3N0CTE9_9ACTN|nr:hypothetical protein [Nocardioides marmoriginsengisoli]RNL66223.1 hypothetical protein EFK50_00945 [Nocardioides marmoriginsengisoli]
MGPAIYLGLVIADPSVVAKLHEKHTITLEQVREAIQWPAKARTAEETHPEHGWRVVAIGTAACGDTVLATLLPVPTWAGTAADTWVVLTARWVR